MRPDILRIAARVVWWKAPETVVASEGDFLCRVMALGTWDDVALVEQVYGRDRLRAALAHAAAGVFDPRSWHYWHY